MVTIPVLIIGLVFNLNFSSCRLGNLISPYLQLEFKSGLELLSLENLKIL